MLQRDLKAIEESYGNEVLNLVLARGYISKLLKQRSYRAVPQPALLGNLE